MQKVKGSSRRESPVAERLLESRPLRHSESSGAITSSLPEMAERRADWPNEKDLQIAGLFEAADGTRTHDLLHGKQWLRLQPAAENACKWRASSKPCRRDDMHGLPGITGDSANQLQTGFAAAEYLAPIHGSDRCRFVKAGQSLLTLQSSLARDGDRT
jgi:hypothetical protein